MNTGITIPAGFNKNYSVPSFIIRYTFPFDEIDYRYLETEKKVEFKGEALDRGKLDQFWKQIYKNCKEFRTLRQSSKLPLVTFWVGVSMLLLGVLLLILGVVPIWGEKKMSMAVIVLSGVIIVLSALTHGLTKVILSIYYRRSLYPKYEEAVVKAVHENLHDYIGLGLSWRGGADGFRCIEFSYVAEEGDANNAANITKNDTVMYSETTEIFKKGHDASNVDISGLFKAGEQVELIKGPPKNMKKGQLKIGIAPREPNTSSTMGLSGAIDFSSSRVAPYDIPASNAMNNVRESHNFDHPHNEFEMPAKRRNVMGLYGGGGISVNKDREDNVEELKDKKEVENKGETV